MAASNYTINFQAGSSTLPVTLPVGTYSYVSNTIAGYNGATLDQFTITPTTTSVALSIAADGTLRVDVKDDLGNPITDGTMQLSDTTGGTRYGTTETIAAGVATFQNVPYDATTGIDFFVAQDTSDTNHTPIPAPQAVDMTQQTQTDNVLNARKTTSVNFTMADKNYAGITPLTGGLVVNG